MPSSLAVGDPSCITLMSLGTLFPVVHLSSWFPQSFVHCCHCIYSREWATNLPSNRQSSSIRRHVQNVKEIEPRSVVAINQLDSVMWYITLGKIPKPRQRCINCLWIEEQRQSSIVIGIPNSIYFRYLIQSMNCNRIFVVHQCCKSSLFISMNTYGQFFKHSFVVVSRF